MMYSDALETSHAMNLPVNHQNEIVWKFDQVSYRKGACIVRMLVDVMGETTFKLGMNKYLQKLYKDNDLTFECTIDVAYVNNRKFQNSDPKEFLSSFEFLGPKLPTNVTSIFEGWANTVGYPCISVKVYQTEQWKIKHECGIRGNPCVVLFSIFFLSLQNV